MDVSPGFVMIVGCVAEIRGRLLRDLVLQRSLLHFINDSQQGLRWNFAPVRGHFPFGLEHRRVDGYTAGDGIARGRGIHPGRAVVTVRHGMEEEAGHGDDEEGI